MAEFRFPVVLGWASFFLDFFYFVLFLVFFLF